MQTKQIGFYSIILLSINSIIGAGIFLNPGSVARLAGSYTPFVFLFASMFAMILALSFASASRYVSENGAAYTYAKKAFGKEIGSYVGVSGYVANSIIWSVASTGIVKIVYAIFHIPETMTSITFGLLLLMCILYFISCFGLKILVHINNISTIVKSGALIIVIIVGCFILITSNQNNITANEVEMISNKMNFSVFVSATIAAFYAYTGFETIASGSKEMKDPQKNLPRAIPITILIVAMIYIGVIAVTMNNNPIQLMTSKDTVVLSSVFSNTIMKWIVTIGAMISLFGINVAYSFHIPRVLETMSKEQAVPLFFAKRNKYNNPQRAFLLSIIITILIAMSFGYTMDNIMIAATVAAFIQYIIVPCSVLCFYFSKEKDKIEIKSRNFFLDVIISITSIVITIVLLFNFDWYTQFTLLENGKRILNLYAIFSMGIGLVILPIISIIYQRRNKKLV